MAHLGAPLRIGVEASWILGRLDYQEDLAEYEVPYYELVWKICRNMAGTVKYGGKSEILYWRASRGRDIFVLLHNARVLLVGRSRAEKLRSRPDGSSQIERRNTARCGCRKTSLRSRH